jgi:hypothetical protein
MITTSKPKEVILGKNGIPGRLTWLPAQQGLSKMLLHLKVQRTGIINIIFVIGVTLTAIGNGQLTSIDRLATLVFLCFGLLLLRNCAIRKGWIHPLISMAVGVILLRILVFTRLSDFYDWQSFREFMDTPLVRLGSFLIALILAMIDIVEIRSNIMVKFYRWRVGTTNRIKLRYFPQLEPELLEENTREMQVAETTKIKIEIEKER